MHRLQVIFISVSLILLSCSRGGSNANTGGNGTVPDTTAPQLQYYTPVADQVFTSGNVINITGKVTDDLGLFKGVIRVIDDANGNIVKEQNYETHYILSYNFNISHNLPGVSVPTTYSVTASFSDHGNNYVNKLVQVRINP